MTSESKMLNLRPKMIVTIVKRSQAKCVMQLFKSLKVHWHYVLNGEGTASSEIMDMLGLGSSDKSIFICIQPEIKVQEFLKSITKELQLLLAGSGIAFSLPIIGVNHYIIDKLKEELDLDSEEIQMKIEQKLEEHKKETHYSLIVGMINQGFSEDVMNTAKSLGVSGGTVVHARRVDAEDAVKFLGIPIQEEKEMLIILTSKEKRHEIMQQLSNMHGFKSEVQGVFLSLPVEEIAGLDLALL